MCVRVCVIICTTQLYILAMTVRGTFVAVSIPQLVERLLYFVPICVFDAVHGCL